MHTSDQSTAILLCVPYLSVLDRHSWLDSVGVSNKLGSLVVVVLLSVGVIVFSVGRLAPGCMFRNAEDEDAADCLTEVGDIAQSDLRLVRIIRPFEGPCHEDNGNDDPEHHCHCESGRPADQILVQAYVSDLKKCMA